ncbi:hypothetical protein Tco_0488628 [Tanacetum coccineum]
MSRTEAIALLRAPPPVDERSWDAGKVGKDNRDFNWFDNRRQAANQGTGGPAPALVKARCHGQFEEGLSLTRIVS